MSGDSLELLEHKLKVLRTELLLKDKKLKNQARELRKLHDICERKNRENDALHYVWCDGGCDGGMHRFIPNAPITPEVIAIAIRNTERMIRWYVNHRGRIAMDAKQQPAPAWHEAENAIGDAYRELHRDDD